MGKSSAWRWIVPCVVGYYVMKATNSRIQRLESERRNARPDTIEISLSRFAFGRSSRAQQEMVLRLIDQPGLYCSRIHFGHFASTFCFQPVPASVGSAGPIEAVPQEQFNNIAGGTLPTAKL